MSEKQLNDKPLTKKQQKFLEYYIANGQDRLQAYIKAYRPKQKDIDKLKHNAKILYYRTTKQKAAAELLEINGLGKHRIVEETEKLLNATHHQYYQGKKVGESPDNAARFNTVNLLANILGVTQKQRSTEVHIGDKKQTLIVKMDTNKLDEPDRDPAEIEKEFIREYERDQSGTYQRPVSSDED